MHLSFGISPLNPVFSVSLSTVSELFCGEILETFVIVLATLLPIKSPVVSAAPWIALLEAILSVPVADCLASSKRFWLYLLLLF